MKTRNFIYLILILLFYSCGSENIILEEKKHTTIDTLPHSDTVTKQVENHQVFQPYTKNPIYLTDNKIFIDSLVPFFKYKNIERLDYLCKKLENWPIDSLKEIVFSSKKINIPNKADTIYLTEYQFLIGSIKTESENSIIAIIDYHEAWGHEIKLLTINKNNQIIDLQSIQYSYGDGGDFYFSTLKYIDRNTYISILENGYYTMTSPIDSTIYTRTTTQIKIDKNATFSAKILKVDSNIIELKKSN